MSTCCSDYPECKCYVKPAGIFSQESLDRMAEQIDPIAFSIEKHFLFTNSSEVPSVANAMDVCEAAMRQIDRTDVKRGAIIVLTDSTISRVEWLQELFFRHPELKNRKFIFATREQLGMPESVNVLITDQLPEPFDIEAYKQQEYSKPVADQKEVRQQRNHFRNLSRYHSRR